MAHTRDLPIWTFRARLSESTWAGGRVLGGGFLWPGARPGDVAERVRARIQADLDKGGAVGEVLGQLLPLASCVADTLHLELPVADARKQVLALDVQILLVQSEAGGWLALAPLQGAAWPGQDAEEAKRGLKQRLTLELLAREDRWDAWPVLDLALASEFEVASVERTFSFPTFAEARANARAQGRVLDKFTRRVTTDVPAVFQLEREAAALTRALASGRSVLLVGPHGGGKSALFRAHAHAHARAFGAGGVREVDAPGLLLSLTEEGPWQEPLAKLVAELAEASTWLYVGTLAELFEVGRYEGNAVSIAEQLRPPIARGEARLVAEATAEEIARIEARYPGFLDGWQRLAVPLPGMSIEAVVRDWVAARAPQLGARFTDDAWAELLRLHRRFSPYSGFPGKTLRGLEALAVSARDPSGAPAWIDRDAVLASYCAESGFPRALIDARSPLSHDDVTRFFADRVFGQPAVVAAMADTIATMKADVSQRGRPLGSLLFVGPTGVGKTETARATADLLFGDPARMVRFDMSEFASLGAVARLIDGPDGEGLLTGAVRRQPFSVVLLDELEKAHPAVLDLLLQVLGEGRLTDARGRTADFGSTVVLMTSNVGAAEARRSAAGFARSATGDREAAWRAAVAGWLRPEMLNRLDRVLAFDALSPEAVGQVLDRELRRFCERPGLAKRVVEIDPDVRAWLAARGFDPRWGARQLLRVVHDSLAVPVAVALNAWGAEPARVHVALDGDAPVVRLSPAAQPPNEEEKLFGAAIAVERLLSGIVSGAVYADQDARHQAALRRRGAVATQATDALGALLGALRHGVDDAADLVRAVGLAALRRDVDDALRARVKRADDEAFTAARRLLEAAQPTGSICVVGIYGRQNVPVLGELYRSIGERHGLRVDSARLLALPEGAERAPKGRGENRKKGESPYWLELPGADRPEEVGPEIGVELRVVGAAAQWLFVPEAGVHLWARSDDSEVARVLVEVFVGDRAAWEGRRRRDLLRKHAYAETPMRTYKPESITGRQVWGVRDVAGLQERLLRRWRAAVADELSE